MQGQDPADWIRPPAQDEAILESLELQLPPGRGLANRAGRAGSEQLANPGTDGHGQSPSREGGPQCNKGTASPPPTERQAGKPLPAALSQSPLLFSSSMRNRERNHSTKCLAFSGRGTRRFGASACGRENAGRIQDAPHLRSTSTFCPSGRSSPPGLTHLTFQTWKRAIAPGSRCFGPPASVCV